MSGGQRKRIHLSRAFYQDKEIYLIDSPLSLLDSKVSKRLAHELIQALKGKTVVIFSNSANYWEKVDRVYVLDEGKIIKEGRFNEIMGKKYFDVNVN